MRSLPRTNLADTAVDAIQSEIQADRWQVGGRLPNEATLSSVLSVSRGTVREVVRVLVAKGYLETRQGSGTYIRSKVVPGEALSRIRTSSLRDLLEVLCAIEVEAARMAATRREPATVPHLHSLIANRDEDKEGDRARHVFRNLDFHRAVIAASGNQAMVQTYEFLSASIMEMIGAIPRNPFPEPDM
jgi:DNA-binding FadR family transcriptional regulator